MHRGRADPNDSRAPDVLGGCRRSRARDARRGNSLVEMATPVVMPQMGESIAEGTIVRWIKKVGDQVDRDEPLFEISTDKVDAEIPSPAAGVLTEIKVHEGETVAVNSVVATIGEAGEAVSAAPIAVPPPTPQPQADGAPARKQPGRPNGREAA